MNSWYVMTPWGPQLVQAPANGDPNASQAQGNAGTVPPAGANGAVPPGFVPGAQPFVGGMPYMMPPYPYMYPNANMAAGNVDPNAANNTATAGSGNFLTGAILGAAAIYLLNNQEVQSTLIKTLVKGWMMFQGGVEEVKERFGDAEAEIRHAEEASEN